MMFVCVCACVYSLATSSIQCTRGSVSILRTSVASSELSSNCLTSRSTSRWVHHHTLPWGTSSHHHTLPWGTSSPSHPPMGHLFSPSHPPMGYFFSPSHPPMGHLFTPSHPPMEHLFSPSHPPSSHAGVSETQASSEERPLGAAHCSHATSVSLPASL